MIRRKFLRGLLSLLGLPLAPEAVRASPAAGLVPVGVDWDGRVKPIELLGTRVRLWGSYNQLDPGGRIIPWTGATPLRLVLLCLHALGVRHAGTIDVPPGRVYVFELSPYPYPVISELILDCDSPAVNVPVNWEGCDPAVALEQLAVALGRRVVYDAVNDKINFIR